MTKKISKKTTLIIVATIAAAIIVSLLVVIVLLLNSKQSDTTTTRQDKSSSSQNSDSTAEKADSDDWVYSQMGETMEFATQDMKVNYARLTNFIKDSSSYSSPEYAGENAKFLIVNMTIRNTTNQTFGYRAFSVIDQDGNQYQDYNAIGSIDNYLDVRDLSPNIPETGNAVYRVSSDSTSFTLFGMNSDTGKTLAVKIKP